MSDGLYTSTVERAAMPVHAPVDGRYCSGTSDEAGLLDERHRGRVLGEEHVGGRRGALRHELVRQLAVTAVAQHDVDARVLRERLRPLLGELLVLRVVDHQRVTRCGAAPPGGAAREQERRDGERNEGSTKQVAHRWDPHDE
jgi:hypothetical protein